MHVYVVNNCSQSFELCVRDIEERLMHATTSAEKATIVYRECQDALLRCKEELVQERLEHWGSKEELQFEKERVNEADKCLDCAYDVLQEAGKMVDGLYKEIAMLKGDQDIVYNSTPTTADLMYQIVVMNRKLDVLDEIIESEDPEALFQKQMLWALDESNDLQRQVQDGWNVLKDTELQLVKEKEENAGLRGIINSSVLNENDVVGRKKWTWRVPKKLKLDH